ncbi:DivIVA domain-containing protein [Amorphoplanes digitatis]|uniref:Cell wall synthesis protein Wag31 n=1 Tax=Actinoplanes digitatis TaxID=1868 RepID=A0A7W7HZX7_9ACTN|nr:DivIVA domain-containing protein [Actinoplanes digitatis]MBB4763873.1 DivIVA domain-containing protein [Actinoplanes digitatis]GID95647.1 cell wall synthesis protein Wag31 [Actinoplanes digitatis]
MPLTPADIHNMAFKKPPIGKRGYDEEEVDAFLDELEQELTRLLEENNALHNQVQRGGPSGPGPSASASALNAEFSELSAQLERLQEARARAEQNARSVQARLEQARNSVPSGPAMSPDGEDRNARVLMMAQRTADDHMRDARKESESLLADAQDKSLQITSDAQLKAGTIEADARRNHSEAMNSLGAKRAALLDEIERLGQLAESYQGALNNHLAQQLQDLDSVAPSS